MTIRVECSHCRYVKFIDAETEDDCSCERCGGQFELCPQCRQLRPAGAVICIHCGLDFRTGTGVVASPGPRHFGDFSIYPMSPGECLLSMRRRFLGIPLGTQEFRVFGFDKVYYDTVDSWTRNVSPTASEDTNRFSMAAIVSLLVWLFKVLAALYVAVHYHFHNFQSSDDSQTEFFFFEVGLLGPHDKFLRLKQSQDSAKVRAIAGWLSDTLGMPIVRRDRRSRE
jgi:hypothetical protein